MTDSIETSESEAQPWAPAGAPVAATPAAVARPAHLNAAPTSFQEAMASMFERNVVAMAAAVIEARQHGAAEGMNWIVNTLAGPGLLPDSECTDAQAYFDLHAPSITACCFVSGTPAGTEAPPRAPENARITLRQAEQLVNFFGGHDAEVTLARELPGQPAGLYAWLTEDPGEGSVYLGPTEVDDELAEKGRPGPAAQPPALMKPAGQAHAGTVTLRISGDALNRSAQVLGWDDELQGLPNGEHVLYAAPGAVIAAPGGAA